MRRGFTLVEVLVAVVVLEVGILGVVGTLVLSAQILRQAREWEAATAVMEAVYDSLRGSPSGGAGERDLAQGVVRWSRGGEGTLVVEYVREGWGQAAVHGREAITP